MPSEERIFELEKATKNCMQAQYEQNRAFTKTMGGVISSVEDY
jgi:hypothetical protein